MIAATADAGVDLLPDLRLPPGGDMRHGQLRPLRSHADQAGIWLELGTKGISPEHLPTFLEWPGNSTRHRAARCCTPPGPPPDRRRGRGHLHQRSPRIEKAGVTLAAGDLRAGPVPPCSWTWSAGIDSPYLGICSDPANSVAALELPADVIDRVAPYVVNMHIKDFAFTRRRAGSA